MWDSYVAKSQDSLRWPPAGHLQRHYDFSCRSEGGKQTRHRLRIQLSMASLPNRYWSAATQDAIKRFERLERRPAKTDTLRCINAGLPRIDADNMWPMSFTEAPHRR